MIPKKIHLCWFSDDPYPVEIKVCLDSWKRILPDYEVRMWRMADARAIGCRFIDEALDNRRWAFASDVVRYYALWKEGGVYMDSDIFMYRRFDEFLPENGEGFVTFHEKIYPEHFPFGLQAAFMISSPGNDYCRAVLDYYMERPYKNPDGSVNELISPAVMSLVAERFGWHCEDVEQHCGSLTVYPTHFLAPRKRYVLDRETIGQHRVYGSWRKRKFGRKIEKFFEHQWHIVRYALFKR